METMNRLDVFNLVLKRESYLIEANAGTGKTYSIEILVLRLVLEQSVPLKKILITTFAKAATQELKNRIKNAFLELYQQLKENQLDQKNQSILSKCNKDQASLIEQIRLTIEHFVDLQIYTIHALFHKLIKEHYYLSAVFDPEAQVSENQEELITRMTIQFWRKHAYQEKNEFAYFFLLLFAKPESMLTIIQQSIKPNLILIPQKPETSLKQLYQSVLEQFDRIKQLWNKDNEALCHSFLEERNKLDQRVTAYKSATLLKKSFDLLCHLELADIELNQQLLALLACFTQSKITEKTKKGQKQIELPLFVLCEHFLSALEKLRIAMIYSTSDYVKKKSQAYKFSEGLIYYEDMIENMTNLLLSQEKQTFINQVQKQYEAALIDEFQDTDFAQYFFFESVFQKSNSSLFYIGDPKQSIYKFRGADVFTYNEAKNKIAKENQYLLNTNYRSNSALVNVINQIFSKDRAFFLPFIGYSPSLAAQENDDRQIILNKKKLIPVQIETDLTKYNVKRVAESVAQDIVHLMTHQAIFTSQNQTSELALSDMAILVQNHKQAAIIASKLAEYHIASTRAKYQYLIETDAFSSIIYLMNALIGYSNFQLQKTALSTPLFDKNNLEIEKLNEEPALQKEMSMLFYDAYQLWQNKSFFVMIEFLDRQKHIRKNLLKGADSLREYTHFDQLVEQIQRIETEYDFTPQRLLQYLKTIDATDDRLAFVEVRIENDDDAVSIITVHRSKGLEYQVIFCPYLISDFKLKRKNKMFHIDGEKKPFFLLHEENILSSALQVENKALNKRLVEQKSSIEEQIENENFSEQLRTLYVALTRAQSALYLYAHGEHLKKKDHKNPFLYLMDQQDDHQDLFSRLDQLTKDYPLDILLSEKEKKKKYTPLLKRSIEPNQAHLKVFSRRLKTNYAWNSFSKSLISNAFEQKIHQFDFDQELEIIDHREQSTAIISQKEADLPHGIQSGLCFHAIIEKINFNDEKQKIEAIIEQQLAYYGFDQELKDLFQKMIDASLNCALHLDDNSSFNIKDIKQHQLLKEVAFNFTSRSFQNKSVIAVLEKHKSIPLAQYMLDAIHSDAFRTLDGFMRGVIDLVFQYKDQFYIIDWKTNYLGDQIEDYKPASIKKYMQEHHYIWQYIIYLIALHKYLKFHLKNYRFETQFGSIFYLFVRGLEDDSQKKAQQFGIYQDNLKDAHYFIDALSDALML